MKPTLQLKLSQHLTLTPQLQQSIKLLQLSTIELNQEIERIVQENPLLEIDDSADQDETNNNAPLENHVESKLSNTSESTEALSLSTTEEVKPDQTNDSDWSNREEYSHGTHDISDEHDFPQQPSEPISLREHLNLQLNLGQITERDKKITGLLIDSLNDDGYLSQDLEELVSLLPQELEISIEDLNLALDRLQHLDPPGIGTYNLKECLSMQLQSLPKDTPCLDKALLLVNEYLDKLASRDFNSIKKLLHCDDSDLRTVQSLITHLNPRPGAEFGNTVAHYIIPDVIVTKSSSNWVANLNPDAMPRLKINHLYANILKRNRNDQSQQLFNQLDEAKWLIKNVNQRFDTILRVSRVIVERQRQFFEHGAVAMRPLVLREISDTLDLHESTISRVTTQKFMRTPRGTFELKYFFGSHVATDSGGACSATAIRAIIKQLINAENTKKPLSDQRISGILEQQGIVVARRTVAKYRESMQIPPVNLRKSI
jgi:RNA polymerase sigma-54 factor